MVTGPGSALLFYRRRTLGEGITLSDTWHVVFLMLQETVWVGRDVQIDVRSLTLHEGKAIMTQDLSTDWTRKLVRKLPELAGTPPAGRA